MEIIIAGLVAGFFDSAIVSAMGAIIRAIASYRFARSGQPVLSITRGAWPLAVSCSVLIVSVQAALVGNQWLTFFALFPIAFVTAAVAPRFQRFPK